MLDPDARDVFSSVAFVLQKHVQEKGRFVLLRHAAPTADAPAEPPPPRSLYEQAVARGEGDAAAAAADDDALQSPPMPAAVRRSLVQAAAHLDGLRHSLELSPLAERAGGDHRAGDVSLSASSVWEGGWTPQGDPLQIFDERLHPLHAGAAPGRACATPSVSAVANWIRSLATTARMGPEASVVGLAYVERFVCCAGVALEAHTWMRVVAAAWLLAAKMWDDDCLENPEFADAFCLDADDLCRLEAAFTAVVGYNLALSPSEYARYYFALRAICQQEHDAFPLRPLDEGVALRLERRAASRNAHPLEQLQAKPTAAVVGFARGGAGAADTENIDLSATL